ncbi:MAG: TlpA family protein disulfide reductase [Verrucomicrobia bacterium]|nr:TlpA family protein disulfide reductase [Verrucomicrobiota bacterium]
MATEPAASLEARLKAVVGSFRASYKTKPDKAVAELLTSVDALGQAFPKSEQPWRLLANVAEFASETTHKKRLTKKLAALDAGQFPKITREAKEELAWLEFLERPIDLRFTAADGRDVDLTQLRGNVVLIYFCASWCPPCVHEYPKLKSVYDKYHKQGFEIVGISADKSRASFDLYTQRKKIPWPQYFEDNAWEGELMKRFRVRYVPRLFLLDRTGRVAHQDTRRNLEEKVKELLAK